MKRLALAGAGGLLLCVGIALGLWHFWRPFPGSRPEPAGAEEYPLAAPPLRLRMLEHDFGISPPGARRSHRFEISNTSSQPWTLKHATSTCACAVGELPSRTVEPGRSAWMEVTYKAPVHDGKVSGHVLVEFAEPGPVYQLAVRGEVRCLLAFDPPSLVLDYAAGDTKQSRQVILRNESGRRVGIPRVDAPEGVTTDIRPVDARPENPAPQEWELTVRVDPTALRRGAGAGLIAVHTDSEEVGAAYLPVRMKAPLEATPDRLSFEVIDAGKFASKKVLLRASPALGELLERDLTVKHTLDDELDVQIHRDETTNQLVLLVRYHPNRPREAREGELEIAAYRDAGPPVRVGVTLPAVSR